jgi:hypothetical protein
MAIWTVILSIIAMFVAGRITGQLTGPQNSVMLHAIVMFGLSVTAALLNLVVGGNAFGNTQLAGTGQGCVIGLFTDLGWPLFIALFLGWLAAMGGAMSVHKEFPRTHSVGSISPATHSLNLPAVVILLLARFLSQVGRAGRGGVHFAPRQLPRSAAPQKGGSRFRGMTF